LSLYLIDNATVTANTVIIKFGRTVKISSLLNQNFIVETDSATPSAVTNPFKTIESLIDYNQINRTLTLYWKVILPSNSQYRIKVKNLVDAAGAVIPEEYISFATQTEAATPNILNTSQAPILNQVLVEDKSIRSDIETGYKILAKNPNFYIESVVPKNGDFFITEDENNGRVVIKFNQRPASNFINSKYFKVQRKKIQKTPVRWESVIANVSMHSWKPEVYVDFPSDDATPVYNMDNKLYFEDNYKYRIIVSSEVGI
jgi:hypothetical protein